MAVAQLCVMVGVRHRLFCGQTLPPVVAQLDEWWIKNPPYKKARYGE
jgi:hypothetical protein